MTTPCREWSGPLVNGYGQAEWGGRAHGAHRVAWTLANGEIPDGLFVLHRCDNRACVRADADPLVSHLFLGTHQDNIADRDRKCRQASGDRNGARARPESLPRGEQHGRAKLTEAQVVDIRARAAAGETQRAIARAFDVSPPNVGDIVRRVTWAHVEAR